ncbi:MAG: hypothetical protein N3G22_00530 [Candidatus Micrarchaeota archaeon]|nr:hypothetical protein [Candidatus Micrarchaeota archaeon]
MEGENRLYTALALAGGFFCLAAAIFFQSAAAVVLASLFLFASLLIWKYGYIILPLLTKSANIVEVGGSFEIPPSQDVVIGKRGDLFFATAFLAARLYESATEKNAEGRAALSAMFEKAISSVGFPFKLSCVVSPLDLKNELEEARAKRSLAESRLEKLRRGRNESEVARLEREIAMWNRIIERLTGGERPLEVVLYLSTTGSGMTRDAAVEQARWQAKELGVVVSSALGCEVVELKGEDMKRCLMWEVLLPSDIEDFHDQLF